MWVKKIVDRHLVTLLATFSLERLDHCSHSSLRCIDCNLRYDLRIVSRDKDDASADKRRSKLTPNGVLHVIKSNLCWWYYPRSRRRASSQGIARSTHWSFGYSRNASWKMVKQLPGASPQTARRRSVWSLISLWWHRLHFRTQMEHRRNADAFLFETVCHRSALLSQKEQFSRTRLAYSIRLNSLHLF